MKREDRSNMLVYGSMVFGGFGPVTPWYENLMTQADTVFCVDHARLQREAWRRMASVRPSTRRQMQTFIEERGSDVARALVDCPQGLIRPLIR